MKSYPSLYLRKEIKVGKVREVGKVGEVEKVRETGNFWVSDALEFAVYALLSTTNFKYTVHCTPMVRGSRWY